MLTLTQLTNALKQLRGSETLVRCLGNNEQSADELMNAIKVASDANIKISPKIAFIAIVRAAQET